MSAFSGHDALEKFQREKFDILVTDFRMEGMNGLELARQIHTSHPNVPVIIVTGYGYIDGGKDVQACLDKERMFPALLETIKTYLGRRRNRFCLGPQPSSRCFAWTLLH